MNGRWWSEFLGRRKSLRKGDRRNAYVSGHDGLLASAVPGAEVPVPKGYSPRNVGNDASARPWEAGADASQAPDVRRSRGFDAEAFLRASKSNFVSLQEAWDRSDISSLKAMMTDGMLAEIQSQLAERERGGAGPNRTEVVMLEAQLLGLEEQDEAYLASVEFSGLIREEPSAGPNPFREIWNITRPKTADSGWLVAGVQALR